MKIAYDLLLSFALGFSFLFLSVKVNIYKFSLNISRFERNYTIQQTFRLNWAISTVKFIIKPYQINELLYISFAKLESNSEVIMLRLSWL